MIYETRSLIETNEIAIKIFEEYIDKAKLFCLYGDLGSGKTTFTQSIGEFLNIDRRVNSPSFLILKQYRLPENKYDLKYLYHLDLYRLRKTSEVEDIGLNELFENKDNLIIIEWADRCSILPDNRLDIKLTYTSEDTRKIDVEYIK